MDHLTKGQLILLALLVSFVTSLVTGIVTVTLVQQAPQPVTQTIQRIVEKTVETVKPEDARGNNSISQEKVRVMTQEALVIELIKNVAPAVGSVVATKDITILERVFVDPFGGDSFLKDLLPQELQEDFLIPQLQQRGTKKQDISSGTGFFVSADGMIVTNRHVVEDSEASYSFLTNEGQRFDVDILARDPIHDIAVLKIKKTGAYPFIPLGDSNKVEVGQNVVSIGNALGEFQNTVSVGVVSGLKRSIVVGGSSDGLETLRDVIQTDAAINPGNSGGPLLNLQGQVIGMNTAVARGAENIGFALPINLIRKDIADVRAFGAVRYPFLGVRYVVLTEKIQKERGLGVSYGALLAQSSDGEPAVLPGSPAANAGLQEGDIVLELGEERIDATHMLSEVILKHQVGETIKIKLLRGNKEMVVSVMLTERPQQ